MKHKLLIVGLFYLTCYAQLKAQVSIDGEYRPRAEFRNGFQKPLADTLQPAFEILQRTRLSFDYKSKILNTRLTMQDARIWGESTVSSSTSKLEIYEAWVEWLVASGFSAQFGRQPLKYDDARLFSPANWSNTGKSHDLLLLKYKPITSLQIHGGFAYNNTTDNLYETDYTTNKMYKEMGFVWLSNQFENGLTTSGIAILEGLQEASNYQVIYPRFTGGLYVDYLNDSSRIYYSASIYVQKGKNQTGKKLNAVMFAGKFGFKVYKQNSVFAGIDYYSGSKADIASDKSNTFEKLYGANHSFNGNMEYFTKNPTRGLMDIYGGLNGKLTNRFSTTLTWHLFNLAQDLTATEKKRNIGSEMDLILDYKVSKEIAIQGGYCMYFKNSNTMDYFKMTNVDVKFPQYAYLMLTIKPNFYKTPVESK